MAIIVAISNQKGGVGKTTTCFSLGACLAELNKRVLVVDLDPQANLTLASGLDYDELDITLVDLLDPTADHKRAAKEVIQPTSQENLDLLPADPRLASVERDLYDEDNYEHMLATALEPWKDKYDYILLDCPPTLSSLTLIAFHAASDVIIPVQCEFYAAKGLDLLLTIVSTVRERSNHNIHHWLLATLFDPRNKVHRTVYEQLKLNFANHLFDTTIRMDTKLRECPAVGEPITLYAPKTRASQQYRQLGAEFLARMNKERNV